MVIDGMERCQFCGTAWHYFTNTEGRQRVRVMRNSQDVDGHAPDCIVVLARRIQTEGA